MKKVIDGKIVRELVHNTCYLRSKRKSCKYEPISMYK